MSLITSNGSPVDGGDEAPKIEFPCANYPVKVLGVGEENYVEVVTAIMSRHVPDLDITQVQIKESSKGRFRSLTFYITATGVDQLQAMHNELSAHPLVKMVI